ncbi:osmotically inducible protein C [Virgibacillus phasianinus]|uniref:Osmotically inducible protein C n=1 Tax=Virgibacillus phasianinus TaxID=2017483 RepID=A0A220TZ70_9BACI|nr:OsmC family protein [Virgibacillus phasianinus]ASK61079.1 osmotically inducible protein C [Virgibacillus phasianinus]
MKFYLKDSGMRIDLDYGELSISGNEDYGYRPFQLMVASIVGCSGSVFRKILEKQRTEFEDLTITADVERNPQEANRIEHITLHYFVKGYNLNKDKLKKNLELSRKNCSMIRSVESSIKIEESLEVIELSR